MKSDLLEALETLRAWCLQDCQDNDKRNEEKGRREKLEVISKILEREAA